MATPNTRNDGETLRRLASIQRAYPEHFVAMEWEPYELALQQGAFASRFPLADSTLWTIVNRNEYDLAAMRLPLCDDRYPGGQPRIVVRR